MFKEQVTTQVFTEDLVYTLAGLAVLLVVAGLALVDAGLSRDRNVLNVLVERLGAILITGLGVFFIGYALWNWQFYQIFGGSLKNALGDWWLGGPGMTNYAQNLDPKLFPVADVQQVFVVFFATFGMATISLIHSSVIERIRPVAIFVIAAVIGVWHTGFVAYIAWGSAAWLTNKGVHDLEGVLPLYVFCGTFALILNWRLRPRLGAFSSHPSGAKPVAHNKALVAVGIILIMFGLPFIALGSGYIVPGVGFIGISMTTSGWGIVLMNAMIAMCSGGLVGVLLAYTRKEWIWVMLGPLGGIVGAGAMLDVAKPWVVMFVAAGGPLVALFVTKLLVRFRIDDLKIIPLGLGAGIYGAIMVGLVEWGTKTGGYIGVDSGPYAFQHASITPWWQLVGVGAVMGIAAITALPLCVLLERFGKLRVSEQVEIEGADHHYWNTQNYEWSSQNHHEVTTTAASSTPPLGNATPANMTEPTS